MPTRSWRDECVFSTPLKRELRQAFLDAGEKPESRSHGAPDPLLFPLIEADADRTFGGVLSETPLSVCMSTHLPYGPVIAEPSLIILLPTLTEDLVLHAGSGSAEINQTVFALEKHPKLTRETEAE